MPTDDTASWGAEVVTEGTGQIRQQIGEILATVKYLAARADRFDKDIELFKSKQDVTTLQVMQLSQRMEAVEKLRQPVEEMAYRYKQALWFTRIFWTMATGIIVLGARVFGPWILHWFGINK